MSTKRRHDGENWYRQTSSVSDMMLKLNLSPLEERRKNTRSSTSHRYHHGAVIIDIEHKPTLHKGQHNSRTYPSWQTHLKLISQRGRHWYHIEVDIYVVVSVARRSTPIDTRTIRGRYRHRYYIIWCKIDVILFMSYWHRYLCNNDIDFAPISIGATE